MPSNNSVRKRVKGIRTGINTLTANYLLQDNEPEIIENWDINEAGYDGVLRKRYGYDRLSSQMASGGTGIGSLSEHTLNGTDYLIGNIINSSSSGLYYQASPYNSTFTAITGGNGSGQAYKLNYASFKNKVYIANRSNGTSTNQVWDGTTTGIYDMGCPPCDNLGITGTPESAGAIQYNYWVTFLYDDYQESGALQGANTVGFSAINSAAITTSSGVNITAIPVSTNTRCTARKIYRSKANEVSVCYFLGILRDNVSTSYLDRQPDTALAEAVDPVYLTEVKKPFISRYITTHKERSILARLQDNEYTALADTTDVEFTDADTGGNLGSGIYKYKIFKGWLVNSGGYATFRVGKVLDKTVDLSGYTGTDNKVTITFQSPVTTDPWYNFVFILRTKVGGSTYFGYSVYASGTFPKSSAVFNDTTADASLVTPLIQIPEIGNPETSFSNNIIVSDAGKPDLFSTIETAQDGTLIPAGNEWNVGEPITGIHSEENRIIIFGQNNIYELDTTTQSRQFWRLNKIVSGTGAKDGLQCQTPEGYFFIQETISNLGTQILRYNNGTVTDVGNIIKTYCFNNSITTFNDIKYYDATREVWVLAENGSITYILKYKIDTGQWRVDVNGTDLNFNVLCPTKSKAMLLGGGDGYVHSRSTALQDKIAGSLTSYTTKVKTKHFNEEDANITPQRFLATLQTSGGSTSTALVRYAVADGTEYTSNLSNDQAGTTNLPDGVHRLRTVSFNDNVTNNGKTDIYFQLETTNAKFEVLKDMAIDLQIKHEASGGK